MRKTLFLAVLLLSAVAALAQSDDRALFGLKGDVTKCLPSIYSGNNPWLREMVEFDAEGRVAKFAGQELYEGQIVRDGKGRIVKITMTEGDGESTTQFTYDANGRVVKEEYFVENLDSDNGLIAVGYGTLTYNDKGLVAQCKCVMTEDSPSGTATYTYTKFDDHGNWTARTAKKDDGVIEESREITYGKAAAAAAGTDEPITKAADDALDRAVEAHQAHMNTPAEKAKNIIMSVVLGLVFCWAAFDMWRKLKGSPLPQQHDADYFRSLRGGSDATDQENKAALQLAEDIEHKMTPLVNDKGDAMWLPTTHKQVQELRDGLARLAAARPTEAGVVEFYNGAVKTLAAAEEREFCGSKFYLILSAVVCIGMGIALSTIPSIVCGVVGCSLYWFASMRPQFMFWRAELNGRTHKSGMNKLFAGLFGAVATAKTYHIITTWSDGTKTHKTDDTELGFWLIVTTVVLFVVAPVISLVALVNYLRNYVLYR